MKEETIIKWHFGQLFKDMRCVSAKIDAPKSNAGLKRDFLECITMKEVKKSKFSPPGRNVYVEVYWHHREDGKHGGSWGESLFETLKNAGADKQGCSFKDSFTVYWKLNPGESFTNGAMRIAKILFRMLDVQIKDVPFISSEMLISLFVVYKVAWVRSSQSGYTRLDDILRERHRFPKVPIASIRQSVL